MEKKLRVWYGLRKLTPKIVKKPSIIVIFENCYTHRNQASVEQKMKILHERFQTKAEMKDVDLCHRVFTVYEILLNDRRWSNSPEMAIKQNFNADSNNVSLKEREIIANKFRKEIYSFYGIKEPETLQLSIF